MSFFSNGALIGVNDGRVEEVPANAGEVMKAFREAVVKRGSHRHPHSSSSTAPLTSSSALIPPFSIDVPVTDSDVERWRKVLEKCAPPSTSPSSLLFTGGGFNNVVSVLSMTDDKSRTSALHRLTPIPPLQSSKIVQLPMTQMLAHRRKWLPLRQRKTTYEQRTTILDAVLHNRVVAVVAERGAGKTLQIPQIIAETEWCKKRRVIVCCANDAAAVTVAHRLAVERGEVGNGTVAHCTSTSYEATEKTVVVATTPAILVRQLLCDPTLLNVGCVIVDDAHMRSPEMDIALTMLRDLVRKLHSSASSTSGAAASLAGKGNATPFCVVLNFREESSADQLVEYFSSMHTSLPSGATSSSAAGSGGGGSAGVRCAKVLVEKEALGEQAALGAAAASASGSSSALLNTTLREVTPTVMYLDETVQWLQKCSKTNQNVVCRDAREELGKYADNIDVVSRVLACEEADFAMLEKFHSYWLPIVQDAIQRYHVGDVLWRTGKEQDGETKTEEEDESKEKVHGIKWGVKKEDGIEADDGDDENAFNDGEPLPYIVIIAPNAMHARVLQSYLSKSLQPALTTPQQSNFANSKERRAKTIGFRYKLMCDGMDTRELERVVEAIVNPKPGVRQIIVATPQLAETMLAAQQIGLLVDCARRSYRAYNASIGADMLETEYCPAVELRQRRVLARLTYSRENLPAAVQRAIAAAPGDDGYSKEPACMVLQLIPKKILHGAQYRRLSSSETFIHPAFRLSWDGYMSLYHVLQAREEAVMCNHLLSATSTSSSLAPGSGIANRIGTILADVLVGAPPANSNKYDELKRTFAVVEQAVSSMGHIEEARLGQQQPQGSSPSATEMTVPRLLPFGVACACMALPVAVVRLLTVAGLLGTTRRAAVVAASWILGDIYNGYDTLYGDILAAAGKPPHSGKSESSKEEDEGAAAESAAQIDAAEAMSLLLDAKQFFTRDSNDSGSVLNAYDTWRTSPGSADGKNDGTEELSSSEEEEDSGSEATDSDEDGEEDDDDGEAKDVDDESAGANEMDTFLEECRIPKAALRRLHRLKSSLRAMMANMALSCEEEDGNLGGAAKDGSKNKDAEEVAAALEQMTVDYSTDSCITAGLYPNCAYIFDSNPYANLRKDEQQHQQEAAEEDPATASGKKLVPLLLRPGEDTHSVGGVVAHVPVGGASAGSSGVSVAPTLAFMTSFSASSLYYRNDVQAQQRGKPLVFLNRTMTRPAAGSSAWTLPAAPESQAASDGEAAAKRPFGVSVDAVSELSIPFSFIVCGAGEERSKPCTHRCRGWSSLLTTAWRTTKAAQVLPPLSQLPPVTIRSRPYDTVKSEKVIVSTDKNFQYTLHSTTARWLQMYRGYFKRFLFTQLQDKRAVMALRGKTSASSSSRWSTALKDLKDAWLWWEKRHRGAKDWLRTDREAIPADKEDDLYKLYPYLSYTDRATEKPVPVLPPMSKKSVGSTAATLTTGDEAADDGSGTAGDQASGGSSKQQPQQFTGKRPDVRLEKQIVDTAKNIAGSKSREPEMALLQNHPKHFFFLNPENEYHPFYLHVLHLEAPDMKTLGDDVEQLVEFLKALEERVKLEVSEAATAAEAQQALDGSGWGGSTTMFDEENGISDRNGKGIGAQGSKGAFQFEYQEVNPDTDDMFRESAGLQVDMAVTQPARHKTMFITPESLNPPTKPSPRDITPSGAGPANTASGNLTLIEQLLAMKGGAGGQTGMNTNAYGGGNAYQAQSHAYPAPPQSSQSVAQPASSRYLQPPTIVNETPSTSFVQPPQPPQPSADELLALIGQFAPSTPDDTTIVGNQSPQPPEETYGDGYLDEPKDTIAAPSSASAAFSGGILGDYDPSTAPAPAPHETSAVLGDGDMNAVYNAATNSAPIFDAFSHEAVFFSPGVGAMPDQTHIIVNANPLTAPPPPLPQDAFAECPPSVLVYPLPSRQYHNVPLTLARALGDVLGMKVGPTTIVGCVARIVVPNHKVEARALLLKTFTCFESKLQILKNDRVAESAELRNYLQQKRGLGGDQQQQQQQQHRQQDHRSGALLQQPHGRNDAEYGAAERVSVRVGNDAHAPPLHAAVSTMPAQERPTSADTHSYAETADQQKGFYDDGTSYHEDVLRSMTVSLPRKRAREDDGVEEEERNHQNQYRQIVEDAPRELAGEDAEDYVETSEEELEDV